jgi:hypothetical protein
MQRFWQVLLVSLTLLLVKTCSSATIPSWRRNIGFGIQDGWMKKMAEHNAYGWKRKIAPFGVRDGQIGNLKTKTLLNSVTGGHDLKGCFYVHCNVHHS